MPGQQQANGARQVEPAAHSWTAGAKIKLGDDNFSHHHRLSFLDLPREIRDLVYHLALTPLPTTFGCEIALPLSERGTAIKNEMEREQFEDNADSLLRIGSDDARVGMTLAIGLLAVSKQVREEAQLIFYGKNVWQMTLERNGNFSIPLILLPKAALNFIEHVHIHVINERATYDPEPDERISGNLLDFTCFIGDNGMRFRTLTVSYVSTNASVLRRILDSILWPTIDDLIVQICLKPLKRLRGRVHELRITGDLSQACIDNLAEVIRPSRTLPS